MAEIITKTTNVEQNFEGEEVLDFTISPEAQGAMIRDAIRMYGDAPEAIAREYITNALDAHIAAGNTDTPIDVTVTFNEEDSTGELVIQDYGVGLDRNGLQIFTSVGTSSKNSSGNAETGSFGRGCKSAFAIASQFMVTTVKDNVKRIAVAAETDKNGYNMTILKTQDTTERNGTRIAIPLSSKYAFRMEDIVRNFTQYLEKGSILVNGEEPAHWLDGLESHDHIQTSVGTVIMDNTTRRQNAVRIKMGSVTYPVDLETLHSAMTNEQREKLDSRHYFDFTHRPAGIDISISRIVLETPLSTLNLLPSRDGLIYTHEDHDTVGTLVGLFQTLQTEFVQIAQERLDETDSAAEAEIVYHSLSKAMNSNKLTWKDQGYTTAVRKIMVDNEEPTPFDERAWWLDVNANRMSVTHNNPLSYREDTLRIMVDATGTDKELTHYRNKLKDYATMLTDAEYTPEPIEGVDRIYIYIIEGETRENPWVFENDSIVKLTVEQLDLEAATYRKHRNALRRRERGNQPQIRRPRQETRYESRLMNGNMYDLGVSEIDDTVENIVIEENDRGWMTDYQRDYLEETKTIIMYVTGNRSPEKLRSNILKLEKDINIITMQQWENMVHNLILQDTELLEKILWANYRINSNILPTLLNLKDYHSEMGEMIILGKTLNTWKDIFDNINPDYAYKYRIDISEFDQDKVAEINSEMPVDEKIYAKYPMLKFLSDPYNSFVREENAKTVYDYIQMMNNV